MEIHEAVKKGDLKALKAAIRRNKDSVNSLSYNGDTPLIIAAREGHTNIVRKLLSKGANVDLADSNGNTPLITAACFGNTDILRELISSQATVDLADKNGDTPLILAAWNGHTDSVKELLSSDATVDLANNNGETPLIKAISNGHRSNVVGELLSAGASVNRTNTYGDTPLILAAWYGRTESIKELLSSEAIVDFANKAEGNTPLINAASNGHTDIVKELLSSGATVDLANHIGDTPLISAALGGYTDIVRVLLSSGATLGLDEKDSETTLKRARESCNSNKETISLLEKAAETQVSTPPTVCSGGATSEVDQEIEKPVYQNHKAVASSVTPPRGRLVQEQAVAHSIVPFYNESLVKEFTSSGGHASYDNGIEIAVAPDSIPPGSTIKIKVQPMFASKNTMPQDVESASPAYLISTEETANLNGEITITIEHHRKVSTKEQAKSLCFLEADPSPDSRSPCMYQEMSEGRSEFSLGESKGKLIIKGLTKKLLQVGAKLINWVKGAKPNPQSQSTTPPRTFSVRAYRSSPQRNGDILAIVCISLYGRFYAKELDQTIIPRDFPEVSTKAIDITTFEAHFEDVCAKLIIDPGQGWSVVPDKDIIFKSEADPPEVKDGKPEDLYDYPPKIKCRFSPKKQAPAKATSILSFVGLKPEVKFRINLEPMASNACEISVDTSKLEVATDQLKSTLSLQDHSSTELATLGRIVSLMENMTACLRLSSLSDLAVHNNSVEKEISTILKLGKKVAGECTRRTIRENINDNLSKIEFLCCQLSHVTHVKLKFCQDQSEKTDALVDLVANAANLIQKLDLLLKELQKLREITPNHAEQIQGQFPLRHISSPQRRQNGSLEPFTHSGSLEQSTRLPPSLSRVNSELSGHSRCHHIQQQRSQSFSAENHTVCPTFSPTDHFSPLSPSTPCPDDHLLIEQARRTGNLDINYLRLLYGRLWDVRPKWNLLGTQLNIDEPTLKAIEKDYHSVDQCFKEMIATFLRQCPPPKVSDLVEALKSKPVDHEYLIAQKIKDLLPEDQVEQSHTCH